ncbi:Mrr restriction system protein [Marinomonas aquimarina]|uniref:Mrr restriction system protein n=1 Tax=Marinomonas aquimarina TaxID=295068 RepID=A0A1A8T9U5_9GAMM|nr:restriction endonuclease [Marinomonas aquimarina]SBS28414.1 Mrr restriction system protein [Marinomonas aquimarina]
MIPNYQEIMRPFLHFLNSDQENESKLRDLINQISSHFGLSDEEKNELLPSGKQRMIDNRVGWARTYLLKAGLIDSPKRAHFVITERGKQALSENIEINNEYLKQFDEFIAFKNKSNEIEVADNNCHTQEPLDNDDITPDEALLKAYHRINQALEEELLTRTRKVSPAFFEQLLIDLLMAMGYGGTGESTAHALGQSGDNGVDGVINQDPLGVDQIYIQAKRYAAGNNVSSGDIRDFFGALNLKRAQKGLFITTSDFTASATSTARDLGSRIVLINGQQLAKLMLRYNIGSRNEQTLHLKKIDEEFFEG